MKSARRWGHHDTKSCTMSFYIPMYEARSILDEIGKETRRHWLKSGKCWGLSIFNTGQAANEPSSSNIKPQDAVKLYPQNIPDEHHTHNWHPPYDHGYRTCKWSCTIAYFYLVNQFTSSHKTYSGTRRQWIVPSAISPADVATTGSASIWQTWSQLPWTCSHKVPTAPSARQEKRMRGKCSLLPPSIMKFVTQGAAQPHW